jgi:circadian clock protein KaiC
MQEHRETRRTLPRIATGIRGFDELTGGGLPANRTCLITGVPGTGKTTFGNQLAFAHAARGGRVLVATLLTETHDVLFGNLQGFDFFDETMIGDQVQYLSVLTSLMEGGLDGTVDTLRQEVRKVNATLLVVDGTVVADDVAPSDFDLRRFAQRLEAQAVLLSCTTVLLTSTTGTAVDPLWAHVNSVVLLSTRPFGIRQVRTLEVVKMRGVRYINGGHEFTITEEGMAVFPRLESLAGYRRREEDAVHGLGTGVTGLDAMMGGGLMPLSTTLVMGTPGAGKTILGLSFVMEGAVRGERGLLVTFHETETDLCATAQRVGLDLRSHVDSRMVRVLWHAPLELSVDEWAWRVLAAVEEQRPTRIYIDALTDVHRLITAPERTPMFVTALVNEIRNHGATTLISAEIDAYASDELAVPVPAASAAMDNCLLLRHVEIHGQLRRLIAVPKVRQAVSDPAIREVQITVRGMNVAYPIQDTSGLLTGRADPLTERAGTIRDEADTDRGR